MNSILIIRCEPPYDAGRSYHGLRLARALSNADVHVPVFLSMMLLPAACKGRKCPRD